MFVKVMFKTGSIQIIIFFLFFSIKGKQITLKLS